uniref:Skp1_POZ domain-containing protein n=1 Tax=Panagrellus redivivus TaxID=6233 RepID=A0A7E4ZYW4_PANRE
MATLLLETTDNKLIAVDSVVIRESNVLKGYEAITTNEAIPVVVSSNALNWLKTFCNFFKDAPAYVKPKEFTELQNLSDDSEPMMWIKSLENFEFFELNEAVAFFDMPRLMDVMIHYLLKIAQTGTIRTESRQARDICNRLNNLSLNES